VPIGAAQAHAGDPQQDLARGRDRERLIVEPEVTRSVQPGDSHACR